MLNYHTSSKKFGQYRAIMYNLRNFQQRWQGSWTSVGEAAPRNGRPNNVRYILHDTEIGQ